ncbi:acyltransferase [Allorhizobium sp. BGMRC 0089]|uniref:acyltransferase family protein n=1 Tax=Allorhizobium sonneratiae TaxID=2934936 RepID=UPI002033F0F6|nr:acyltransferase [Allorhizobium sonneratiae]MCM2291949.1 acyltransferase [Allorhizobium sonneratiae]
MRPAYGDSEPALNRSVSRYESLDSLRGLAAFGVLLTHCLQIALPQGMLNHTPLRIFVNGRSFVIFFFVLSGFVLAHAIWSKVGKQTYLRYAARRLVRLYPPYCIAGLIGMATGLVAGRPDMLMAFASYCAALGTNLGISINPPSWSLVFELRISLLMPFLALLIARKPLLALGITSILFCIEEVLLFVLHIGQFPYGADTIGAALVITARFLVCFAVGGLLAHDVKHQNRVWGVIRSRKWLFLVLAYLLMSVLLDQMSIVGSVVMISLALNWTALKQRLEWPVLKWLGRISYSLYLTHFIILQYLQQQFGQMLGPQTIALIAIPVALLAAEIFFEFIERPAILWSQRV